MLIVSLIYNCSLESAVQKLLILFQSTPFHVNQMNTLKIRMEGILNCMRKLHNDENVESRRLCVQLITSSSHAMGGLWTLDLTQNGFHQL